MSAPRPQQPGGMRTPNGGPSFASGETVSKEEGVAMAKAGEIQGVGVAHRKDSEYLKSLPDGTEGNNLGNLPSVSG